MPFTPVVYVAVCPLCVLPNEISAFQKLVRSGIVIPILTGRYDSYDSKVREAIIGHDHVSMYEYQAYRFFSITQSSSKMICSHCAGKRFKSMRSSVRRIKAAPLYSEHIERLGQNIYPFVHPDFTLIDMAAEACKARDYDRLDQLVSLSEGLHELRSAQAFHSAVTVAETDISEIPEGTSTETDEALQTMAKIRAMATEGLGLKFPADVSIDRYIELAKDYQPQISDVVAEIGPKNINEDVSIGLLSKRMNQLNREIERIHGLKRYAFLEASVAVVKQHRAVITTALIASALGLAGSLVGCASAVVGGASLRLAKKRGWIKENGAVNRVGRMIARDLQPHLNRLIAKYVGSTLPAVKVLSLRKKLEIRKAA